MVPLTSLWLPILLSAVFVFAASFVLHMLLAFWHRPDYQKAPAEGTLLDAIRSMSSGQYLVPYCDWGKMTPEERKTAMAGPTAMMMVRNPSPSFGATLAQWFVLCVVVSLFTGYLTGRTLDAGAAYMHVHRVAATAAFMAWSLGSVTESIWAGRPWGATFRHMVDGLIYALLTGGTFGWLWP